MAEQEYQYRGVTIRRSSTTVGTKVIHRWSAIVKDTDGSKYPIRADSKEEIERRIDEILDK